MLKKLGLILLFACSTLQSKAQEDSTSLQGPFQKGRQVVNLLGAINSTSSDQGTGGEKKFSNNYNFSIELGKFVANKHVLGLHFNTNRSHTEHFVFREREMLTIGPFYRYYLSNESKGSPYLQANFTYLNYVDISKVQFDTLSFSNEVIGDGLSTVIGIGYTYVMRNRVGFDIGFEYQWAYVKANRTDKIMMSTESLDVHINEYLFHFGFIVFFDRIRK